MAWGRGVALRWGRGSVPVGPVVVDVRSRAFTTDLPSAFDELEG
jgi:hypothetical protein